MNARARWLGTAALALILMIPSASAGQERAGWTFRGTSDFGIIFATRDLAKNLGGDVLVAEQVSTRLDQSLVWGAGVEAMTPDQRTIFRGMVRQTAGGSASARVLLCRAFQDNGELCIPRPSNLRLTSFHGEVVFVQGDVSDRFRQNFIIGAGLRSYQFAVEACVPSASNPDLFRLCELVQEMYENQAPVQGFIQFGFGFSYDAGPLTFSARINDIVGPYIGGSGNTDGDFQNDVIVSGGISFRVR